MGTGSAALVGRGGYGVVQAQVDRCGSAVDFFRSMLSGMHTTTGVQPDEAPAPAAPAPAAAALQQAPHGDGGAGSAPADAATVDTLAAATMVRVNGKGLPQHGGEEEGDAKECWAPGHARGRAFRHPHTLLALGRVDDYLSDLKERSSRRGSGSGKLHIIEPRVR